MPDYDEGWELVDDDELFGPIKSNLDWQQVEKDFPERDIVLKFMRLTRIKNKKFKNKRERNRWIKLCERVRDGEINRRWLDTIYDWASDLNRREGKLIITFPKVLNALMNERSYDNWAAKNLTEDERLDFEGDDEY